MGLAAVVIILVRGKTLFFDEHASRSAAVGSIRYDGAVSLFEGRTTRTRRNTGRWRITSPVDTGSRRMSPSSLWVLPTTPVGRWAWIPLLILAVMAVESRFNR